MAVLSRAGRYIVHKNLALQGAMSAKAHPWMQDYVDHLKRARPFTLVNQSDIVDENVYRVARPFSIGKTCTSWTVMATIHVSQVMAQANAFIQKTNLTGKPYRRQDFVLNVLAGTHIRIH
jgi:hypothetical protein